MWQLNEALESQLLESFKANTLSEWITQRTHELVLAYATDIQQGLEKELPKTKLSGLPIEGVTRQFIQSLMDSVEYMTAIRSEIEEPKLSNMKPFSTVTDFDSKALTLRLGYLTSTISEHILREIEREIKTIKEEKRSVNVNETNGTQLSRSTRDLSYSDSSIEGGKLRQEATREVRTDGVELSERGTHQSVQLPSKPRDTASTDASSERGSMGEDGETSRPDATRRTHSGPGQYLSDLSSQRDDQNKSGGDSSSRNHLQGEIAIDLELPERSSFLMELTEDELIEKVLLRGSGFEGGKQRIVDFFSEEHTAKEKADFLKNEYGTGGSSVTFSDDLSGFENHDSKGITIDIYKSDKEIHLSWAKVASSIEALIDNGKYFEPRYKNDNPPTRKTVYQPTLFDLGYAENDIRHENYKKLIKIAPGILNGRYRYMKLKAPGFMDLVIERLYENRISLSHYYEQNGDLMSDSDMELIVDHNQKTLLAATFQQDNMAIYHAAYQGDELINPDLEDELNDFLKDWLSNIARQAHIVYKAYYLEDIDEENQEPIFDDNGHEIIIEASSKTDDLLDLEDEDLHEYPLEVGMEVDIEGRKFQIESIDYDSNAVSLMDLTFAGQTGYPIFRKESVDFVLDFLPDEKPLTEEEKWGIVSVGSVEDEKQSQEQYTKINYQFSPEDEIGIGGLKTKFRANVEAIKTLKVIETENRMATDKEQSILARYVGWGGMPGAFDIGASGWSNEYAELKNLLSQGEYDSAKASTPNAHYTSSVVIQSIYQALDQFGFKNGNILEPSLGVGNFFSHLSDSMNKSKLFGVELDDVSGRIARQLYQKAQIQIKGY